SSVPSGPSAVHPLRQGLGAAAPFGGDGVGSGAGGGDAAGDGGGGVAVAAGQGAGADGGLVVAPVHGDRPQGEGDGVRGADPGAGAQGEGGGGGRGGQQGAGAEDAVADRAVRGVLGGGVQDERAGGRGVARGGGRGDGDRDRPGDPLRVGVGDRGRGGRLGAGPVRVAGEERAQRGDPHRGTVPPGTGAVEQGGREAGPRLAVPDPLQQ